MRRILAVVVVVLVGCAVLAAAEGYAAGSGSAALVASDGCEAGLCQGRSIPGTMPMEYEHHFTSDPGIDDCDGDGDPCHSGWKEGRCWGTHDLCRGDLPEPVSDMMDNLFSAARSNNPVDLTAAVAPVKDHVTLDSLASRIVLRGCGNTVVAVVEIGPSVVTDLAAYLNH